MATIAIGDIHGNVKALEDVLAQLEAEVLEGDTIVFLGDYIDRGPSSKQCIDRILSFRSSTAAAVVGLLGNHEDWLLRAMRDPTRHSWLLGMEAFETVESYSKDAAAGLRAAAEEVGLAFFKALLTHCRTADGVFVRGGLDSRFPTLEDQPRQALLWGTDTFPADYAGREIVVYGHWGNARLTPAGWPEPAVVGRTIGIDTSPQGVVTAIRLPDRRVFQSARSTGWNLDVEQADAG
jgi:serine/threonine protein phosphatase 1